MATLHDAKWYALGANKDHGERMTNADKRHGVIMALEDEELSKLSDREIANQCRVSHMTVNRIRTEFVTKLHSNIQTKPEREPQNLESIINERVKPTQENQKLRAELEALKTSPSQSL